MIAVDWVRYDEAKKVSALLAKVSTAFTAAVLDPKGKTLDVARANEAAEQALRYNFLVAPLVLPLAVPLAEGVAALVAAGVSYCTAQHIMAAYERGDFDVIAHNLMEVGDVIVDRVGQGIQYFLKGESYRSPQDVVEAYLRDAMRAAVPFEARGDKPVYAGAKVDLDGYENVDVYSNVQGLNLTPTDHNGGSILGTPAHRVGPQVLDTPVYEGKPEPFVTPLPETGPGSLVTPIPGDQLNPLPGFVPANDDLRGGNVLLREGDINFDKDGRAYGKYGKLSQSRIKDAHHIIQDAAVRNIKGYSRKEAPSVQLKGPSTEVNSEHYHATQVQRKAGGGTYGKERKIAYRALREAGLDKESSRDHIARADEYFEEIDVKNNTQTRIPGNRSVK